MTVGGQSVPQTAWASVQRWSIVAAAAGGLLGVVSALTVPERFFRAYLVAFNFWLGIALGCFVLLMLQYLTGGAWGILLRRILEAASATVPLLILLFVPVAFGVPHIFPWASTDAASSGAADVGEAFSKARYLTLPMFIGRAGAYFFAWLLFSTVQRRWSLAMERHEFRWSHRALRLMAAWGLVAYGLTITLASIDWVMSLEPNWYSTIYPPLFGVGQILSGMALAISALAFIGRYEPIAPVIQRRHWRDLGNLLLAFVMCWAYLSFSQFLLIWSENLPEEIPWYLKRTRGGWQSVAVALVIFQFAVPFLLLLSRDVKESSRRLRLVALLVLTLYLVNLFWWIEAASPEANALDGLLTIALSVGVGGIWCSWFVQKLKIRSLLAVDDPYFPEYLPAEAAHG